VVLAGVEHQMQPHQLLLVVLELPIKALLVEMAVVQAVTTLAVVVVEPAPLVQTHQALMVVMGGMVLHPQSQVLVLHGVAVVAAVVTR
jgi:hypothetical protein